MRRLFKALTFFIKDTWASRKEAVDMPDRREYYRDSSDIYGRGLGGADGKHGLMEYFGTKVIYVQQ